jgi:N-acyl-D-amino-acid deacylase
MNEGTDWMSTVIKNIKIYDGSGKLPFIGDVKFDEFIIQIASSNSLSGEKIIDGTDLALAPGFIDTHSHSDLEAIKNPELLHVVSQGVTTELVGQDGSSVAPVTDENLDELMDNMAPLAGNLDKPYYWRSVEDYKSVLEDSCSSTKIEMLIGHGTIRMAVLGSDDRQATKSELESICKQIDIGMRQGAKGVSFGLIYPPGSYANTEELIEVAKIVASHDGIIMVHMRNEQDEIMKSIDEMERVIKESGVRLHISHLKALGYRNWGSAEKILKRLDEIKKHGYDITFDQYPYSATCTGLKVIVPIWAYAGGEKAFIKRLSDKEEYKRILLDTRNNIEARGGAKRIMIASVVSDKNQWMAGKDLEYIAKKLDMHEEEVALKILHDEGPSVVAIYFSISDDDVERIMKHPLHGICTDGIIGDHPHPRAYGSFPRVLGYYVRELNLLSMQEAIRQMTSEAAYRLRIFDRGLIRVGMKADLVVFDENKVNATNSYSNPTKISKGIKKVFVDGKIKYTEEEN